MIELSKGAQDYYTCHVTLVLDDVLIPSPPFYLLMFEDVIRKVNIALSYTQSLRYVF